MFVVPQRAQHGFSYINALLKEPNMHGPHEKVSLLSVYFLPGRNRGGREEGAEVVQVVV